MNFERPVSPKEGQLGKSSEAPPAVSEQAESNTSAIASVSEVEVLPSIAERTLAAERIPLIEQGLIELDKEYEHLRAIQGYAQFHTLQGSLELKERFLNNATAISQKLDEVRGLLSRLPEEEAVAYAKRVDKATPYHPNWETEVFKRLELEALKALPARSLDGRDYPYDHKWVEKVETVLHSLEDVLREAWKEEADNQAAFFEDIEE